MKKSGDKKVVIRLYNLFNVSNFNSQETREVPEKKYKRNVSEEETKISQKKFEEM